MKKQMRFLFGFVLILGLTMGGPSALAHIRGSRPPIANAAPLSLVGSVRYAKPGGLTSGDCGSWANACSLQRALSVAVSGDEIWVQAGVHKPGLNRTDTFTLKDGVAIYGGFAGTESNRSQRDWQTNRTILSGDIDNNDINTDGNNIAEAPTDIVGYNAYHVVTGSGTSNTAVLDGFVITAGQANGGYPHNRGAGVYNNNSSPQVRNVILSGNVADSDGGGMYNQGSSSPALTDVTFSNNSAGFSGGGMYNGLNSPTLINVTFSGNAAGDGGGLYNASGTPTLTHVVLISNTASNGGGMYNDYSNLALTNVTFEGNSARFFGGGMLNYHSSPTLTGVIFHANRAKDGGGMFNNDDDSNPIITRATFSQNIASHNGGGMYQASGSSPHVTNAVFTGNQASDAGGGMYNNGSSPILTNTSFYGNSANNRAGGIRNYSSSNPILSNVIVWGNIGPEGQIVNDATSTPSIAYSDVQGCGGSGSWNSACGTDNGGNIDTDPRFVNAAMSDLHLQLDSPAIDAGKNSAVPAGVTTDLDIRPRFVDIPTVTDTGNGTPPIVDMGAYEVQISGMDHKAYLPLSLR